MKKILPAPIFFLTPLQMLFMPTFMIANDECTAPTMLEALAHTLGALQAAGLLDVDRTTDERAFFEAERASLQPVFDGLFDAHSALEKHNLLSRRPAQGFIEIGDTVLDRGVRKGKKRVALELSANAADQLYGEDISEVVDAERHLEPALVLAIVDKHQYAPDFQGKADLVADLTGRATRQQDNFKARATAFSVGDTLDNKVEAGVKAAADALYKLEKRLLERFPRDKVYVRAFFMDVGYKRKRAEPGQTPPEGGKVG